MKIGFISDFKYLHKLHFRHGKQLNFRVFKHNKTTYIIKSAGIVFLHERCADPLVLVEQRLDFSRWVQDSFGTADCIIVADAALTVIDMKYGVGCLVEAEENPQMRMYALGALHLFEVDIHEKMC